MSTTIEDLYPLSPMQQGMLFHSLQAPDSGVYVEQMSCTLRGALDVAAFRRAWELAVARHAILRSAFVWEDVDEPLQVVQAEAGVPLDVEDWRGTSAADQEERFRVRMAEERRRGFDLADAPLMRLTLLRTADDAHRLIWTHHHLLLDGWSLPLLLGEVLAAYEAFAEGEEPELPPVRPYRDYIAWLQEQDSHAAERFWRAELGDVEAPTPLPLPRPADEAAGAAAPLHRVLEAEVTEALQAMARRNGLTLSTVVQGAWAVVLGRCAREEDVVFGATVSGRPAELPGAETMVGLFINTLPVRVRLPHERPVTEWLRELQARQVELRQYEYSPLVQVQGWSGVPRGTPLFESLVVFENYPVGEALRSDEPARRLRVEAVDSVSRTNLPLLLEARPGAGLHLTLDYDAARFDRAAVARMLEHLTRVLAAIAADPDAAVGQIPMLAPEEYEQVVTGWNRTAAPYPDDRPLHRLVEEQAAARPDAPAVRLGGTVVSYAELDRRAGALAARLHAAGVARGTLVGLCTGRSVELVVGMLGILKAGGAFVPLDPAYPADRIAWMLGDSGVRIVAGDGALASLPGAGATVVRIDEPGAGRAAAPEAYDGGAGPDDLAYVIYTSGSTGRPKGVLLRHRGVCNLVAAQGAAFDVRPGTRVLQFASYSFDAAVSEIFVTLGNGGELVLAPADRLTDAESVAALLAETAVEVVTLPPALLAVLPDVELPALRTLVSAGDACPWPLARRWSRGRRFMNAYGPTEATVGPTFHIVDGETAAERVPIGRPIGNMRVYVLDRRLRPLPVGVPGELCVAGVGVAAGYLGRPELTAERFLDDPFVPGERMYRTGDLGRWLPDGTLEFLGRTDDQVKVRGYRIEPGEIEHALREQPGVRDAAVVARTDQPGGRLVAYVVCRGGAEPDEASWRSALRARLPEYMVPALFVVLDELPLTPNGKVDRRALPAPEAAGSAPYAPPRTPVQELVAGICAEVLGTPRVGLHDDFFELGGHSLLVTQLVSRLRQAFEVELPIGVVFEAPTVERLAERVELAREAGSAAAGPIPVAPRDGDLPLSFAQQRLWFLDQLEPDSPFYNNPAAIRLRGRLDAGALKRALDEIVRRHEALRTGFHARGGQPFQVIAPELEIPVPVADLRALPAAEREAEVRAQAVAEAQRPFDLRADPLLRVRLLRLADDEHVALLTLHHIVSDGWSMGVLIRELGVLYQAFVRGDPSPLPPLPIQYADFAAWQRRWLSGPELDRQVDWWTRQLAGAPALLELPTDHPRPPVQTFRGRTVTFRLPAELSRELQALSRREGATLFMTLLAAWQALLGRLAGQDDVVIGTPIANRTRAETEGLIGFFVNTLVLRTDLSGEPTFRELVARVRQTALGAYAHQDLPFEQLVEIVQPARDLSHSPLFQVMFVLDNAPREALRLPGLTLEPVEAESGTARFDLTLSMSEGEDGLGGSLEYNTDLFEPDTIDRLLVHFRRLLEAVSTDPDRRVAAVPLLGEAERERVLHAWNATDAAFPHDRCVHALVAEQARRQPSAPAVVFEDRVLTYGELNEAADRLARYLHGAGVGRGTLVGIALERSPELPVAVLGVLKAGGAFVPLDPTYPPERLAFMAQDARLRVLVTTGALADRVPAVGRVIHLDAEAGSIAASPAGPPDGGATPRDLAYVIYTSGSTGQPKGVELEHRGAVNLAFAQQRAFGVGPGKRVLQFAPFSFDAAVWELLMALASGAALVVARQEALAGPGLLRVLRDQAVTTVTLPPSLLAVLDPGELPALETVIAAGEACSREIVARWAPGRRFFNAYGPTEVTVCATMALCTPTDEGRPPIGRPLPNVRVYVLDPTGEPVPVGVAGELYVGGAGVARGYLGRPELTAERFVPDPFGPDRSGRLYRTGDLVRWRADGNLEFLGRVDQQVKLRGFRIEPGEIESALRAHPAVADALVEARQAPGGPRLVAWVVPAGADLPDLRPHLRELLPEYMVPGAVVPVAQWPLTPSGKIDRRALPEPELRRDAAAEYVAPRTPEEERLAAICAELLGVERVGVRDSFFELGGHSLLATQLLSRIRDAFEVELPLRTLFELPTVEGLAGAVAARREQGESLAPEIRPVSREGRRIRRSAL